MYARQLVLGALGTVAMTLYRGIRRSRERRRAVERTRERAEIARWEGEGGALRSARRTGPAHGARR